MDFFFLRALKWDIEEQNCCGGEKICPHKCHDYWTPLLESHTELSTLTGLGYSCDQGLLASTLRGQWQSHMQENPEKQHSRSTWGSSHKVYHSQRIQCTGLSVFHSLWSGSECITGCDGPALPGTGWQHRGHRCFFSSRNAHQALPFASLRAAHILPPSHWSSQSLDRKKITNNGFVVFCFTTH